MPVIIIRRAASPPAQQSTAAPKGKVIIKRVPKAASAAPGAPAFVSVPAPITSPVEESDQPPIMLDSSGIQYHNHPRGWAVGGGVVLRRRELTAEEGVTKFILHRVKEKVWYRVVSYDADERRMTVQSQTKFEFDSRVDATFDRNYIVAMFPKGILEPHLDALVFVSRKLPVILAQLQSSAQPA